MEHKKIAVVTGAAKGIGRAIVLRLIEDGYFIVAIDIDEKGGKKLLVEFGKEKVCFAKADICKEKIIQQLFEKILKLQAVDHHDREIGTLLEQDDHQCQRAIEYIPVLKPFQ